MTTRTPNISFWDRIMMAITFAEADDEKAARELFNSGTNEQLLNRGMHNNRQGDSNCNYDIAFGTEP